MIQLYTDYLKQQQISIMENPYPTKLLITIQTNLNWLTLYKTRGPLAQEGSPETDVLSTGYK